MLRGDGLKGGPLPRNNLNPTYDSGLGANSKVADIVNGKEWRWPVAQSMDLMNVRENVGGMHPDSSQQDKLRWFPAADGVFTIRSAWSTIREKTRKVSWHEVVWLPKHIFLGCLL